MKQFLLIPNFNESNLDSYFTLFFKSLFLLILSISIVGTGNAQVINGIFGTNIPSGQQTSYTEILESGIIMSVQISGAQDAYFSQVPANLSDACMTNIAGIRTLSNNSPNDQSVDYTITFCPPIDNFEFDIHNVDNSSANNESIGDFEYNGIPLTEADGISLINANDMIFENELMSGTGEGCGTIRIEKDNISEIKFSFHRDMWSGHFLSHFTFERACDRVADSLAMVAFYTAADGANWTNQWDFSQPMDTWYGVQLHESGCVKCIDLDGDANCSKVSMSGNNLGGTLSAELGNLPHLESLFLNKNQITGNIPPELAQLCSLRKLYLGDNDLTGVIPVELGQILSLTNLYLADNQLSGSLPTELSNLLRLTEINCSNNLLMGCFPATYDIFCNIDYDFYNNTNLPDGGNFDHFCLNETGSCNPSCLLTNYDDLVALYNATDGASWTTTWDLSQPISTWHGVTLSNGCVTGLYLNNNNLNGTIPPEIGNLKTLVSLNLSNNLLSGNLPIQLGDLPDLQTLELKFNQLTGSIPTELGQLSKLKRLNLEVNDLTGHIPSSLGQLTNLLHLVLFANELEGTIPPELGQLTNLLTFYLANNQLSGVIPPELGQLVNVQNFYLHFNNLTGTLPVELAQLSLLRLYLQGNQLSGCIPFEYYNFCGTTAVDISLMPMLDGNGNFSSFCNSDNGACPPPCRYTDSLSLVAFYEATNGANWLPAIAWDLSEPMDNWYGVTLSDEGCVEILSVIEFGLTGYLPAELGDLSELTELWLHVNDISGSIPPELGNLSNLNILMLQENNLSGSIPPELGNLTNLTRLGLISNDLTGNIPPELGNLTSLTDLELTFNELSGSIPVQLANLINLRQCLLGWNDLTGSIPFELGNLSNLVRLNLGNNLLIGDIPVELGTLSALIDLNLGHNQLTGELPMELGNLTNLTSLRLNDNLLAGCFPSEFTVFCDFSISTYFSNNANLPGGGDFPAFCNNDNSLTCNSDLIINLEPYCITTITPEMLLDNICMDPNMDNYSISLNLNQIDANFSLDQNGDCIFDNLDTDIVLNDPDLIIDNGASQVNVFIPGIYSFEVSLGDFSVCSDVFELKDVTGPIFNLINDDEAHINYDIDSDDIIEIGVNDPSGTDDLANEYILSKFAENNGVDIYFDILEAEDADRTGNGQCDDALDGKADFVDCSGVESVFFEAEDMAICDPNNLANLPVDNTRFDANEFEIIHYYKRTWFAIDKAGNQSENGVSQYVFVLRPKAHRITIIEGIELSCMPHFALYGPPSPSFTTSNAIHNNGSGSDGPTLFNDGLANNSVQAIADLSTKEWTLPVFPSSSQYSTTLLTSQTRYPCKASEDERTYFWTITDLCSNTLIFDEFPQTMNVLDYTAPSIHFENGDDPDGTTFSVYADPIDGYATGNIPLLFVEDNCTLVSPTNSVNARIDKVLDDPNDPNISVYFFLNGGDLRNNLPPHIDGLPIGTYLVTYNATDDCAQASETVVLTMEVLSDALATKLLTFKATSNKHSIGLDWTTNNEDNMQSYQIERSTNQTHFEKIRTQTALNKNTATYHFEDNTVEPNTLYYYRLKMVEQNGSFDYSDIVSAQINGEETTIKLFPNPATEQCHLVFETPLKEAVDLTIFNALGQIQEQLTTTENQVQLDLKTWATGLYYIQVQQNQQNQVLRLVKK